MNTDYFRNLVAGNVFGTKKDPAIPAKYYLGLSTTAPTTTGTNVTEPTGNGYARVELKSLSAPSSGTVSNTAAIDFPESTGSWGTVTHYLIYDALTAGNLLIYGALTNSRNIETATIMTVKANNLAINVINPT